jgi:hypothetical protein
MATAADIIKRSLRDIGALAAGETPSSAEESDALESLNELLEHWSNDGFLVYKEERDSFTLVVGQQQYTIGTGGDIAITRPQEIVEASTIQAGNSTEINIRIINQQEWARVPLKSTGSTIPQYIYVNYSYPLMTIDVWPEPSAASELILYSRKPLTAFANAAATVSLPQGYLRALRKNLAVDLSPEYGKTPSQILMKAADDSLSSIRRVNTKDVLLATEVVNMTDTQRPFDYRTGE